MKVSVAKTYTDACAALDGSDSVRALQFILRYFENPANPGSRLERVQSVKDQNIWSARIALDLRAILYHQGDEHVLLYAGQHDDAYEWASRRKFDRHSLTGELQIVVLPETYQDQVSWFTQPSAAPKLFSSHADDYLRSIGAPDELLPLIRCIESEDQLIEICDKLPQDLADNLCTLATGGLVVPPQKPASAIAPPLVPASNERFWVVPHAAELADVLNKPFEAWLRYLHPSQRQLVEGTYGGAVKVTGAAGTGKTVVALHRARELARRGERVLLTTFVKTLARTINRSAGLLLSADERKLVTVNTIASEAFAIVRKVRPDAQAASDQDVNALIKRFSLYAPGFDERFLRSEWRNVVERQGIVTWDEYRDASRTGRRQALSSGQRQKVWGTFQRVLEELHEMRRYPWHVIYRWAEEWLNTGKVERPYSAIIVDEVQDFATPMMRFVGALAGERTANLMIVGDVGQQIYPGGFSLQKLGIDVRGRSRVLRINYRTTRQIQRVAERLRGVIDEDTNEKSSARSLMNGPEPQFLGFKSQQEHDEYLVSEANRLLSSGLASREIAFFARTNELVSQLRQKLEHHGVKAALLEPETDVFTVDGVLVGTMHRAKGHEFKSVYSAYCSHGVLPSPGALQEAGDAAEEREVRDIERQLLYVTLTRARDHATVTWVGEPSPYVEKIRIGASS